MKYLHIYKIVKNNLYWQYNNIIYKYKQVKKLFLQILHTTLLIAFS